MAERCPATWSHVTPPFPSMATRIVGTPGLRSSPLVALVPGLALMTPPPSGVYQVYFDAEGAGYSTTAAIGAADVSFECQLRGWQR
jgi:hypothetical protein